MNAFPCSRSSKSGKREFRFSSKFRFRFSNCGSGSSMTEYAEKHADMRQGAHSLLTFRHSLFAVHVNQIDRESHAEGMHGFTGNDPHAFSRSQAIASQQPFAACGSVIGYFHPFGKYQLASQIRKSSNAHPVLPGRGIRRSSIRLSNSFRCL